MTILDAQSMHRLAKLALDAGEVSSPEEALEVFSRYRLRIHLGAGWADTLAGQACFLTALNTAARAFLGGVEVSGDLEPAMRVPLFDGRRTRDLVEELGGVCATDTPSQAPMLVLGTPPAASVGFGVLLSWDGWCAAVTPVSDSTGLTCSMDNPLAGVAAAALGVNEAFAHVRGDLPDAGARSIGLSLWRPLLVTDWNAHAHRGPALEYLPSSLWLVGLGHLGQAYAWTLAMLPYPTNGRAHLVLQDFDKAGTSNLSTCLLLTADDVGKRKVRHVAARLEAAGFTTDLVERRFGPHHRILASEPSTALFGVDNLAARRDLDSSGFAMVVEAGLGSGFRDFRNLRTHTFPGPSKPSEIWMSASAVQTPVELNDAYQQLARERDDLCGMTLLASRAVATPFVGALAAALVVSEIVRPLHGGCVHPVFDLQMKNLRFRTGSEATSSTRLQVPFVEVVETRSATTT